jgi:hypothetical protein
MVQHSSKLLVVLVSTIIVGFGPRHFSFKTIYAFVNGASTSKGGGVDFSG